VLCYRRFCSFSETQAVTSLFSSQRFHGTSPHHLFLKGSWRAADQIICGIVAHVQQPSIALIVRRVISGCHDAEY